MSEPLTHLLRRCAAHCRSAVAHGALCVVMLGVIWTLIGLDLARQHAEARFRAEQSSGNQVRAFQESLVRTIASADQAIRFVRVLYAREGERTDLAAWVGAVSLTGGPAFQIAIIDRSGILRASSLGPVTDSIDLSDREHFRVHLRDPADLLFISRPVQGRVSGQWSIQLTRKLLDAKGDFAGVVVVSLDPYRLVQGQEPPAAGSAAVSLLGTDGIVRAARRSGGVTLGRDLSRRPLFRHLARADQGSYISPAVEGQGERLVAYRRMRDYPLVITAAIDTGEVYEAYRLARHRYLLAGASLSTLVCALGWLLMRYHRRGRRSQRMLQAAVENISQGIIMVDDRGTVPVINRRAARLLGLPPVLAVPGRPAAALCAWKDEVLARNPGETGRESLWRLVEAGAGRPDGEVVELVGRDGSVLEVRRHPLPGGGTVRTFTDITERRRHEEELRQTRAFLDQVIENLPGTLFVKDAGTGRFTLVNRGWEVLLGLSRAATIGTTVYDHFPKEQADAFAAADRAALASGTVQVAEEVAVDTPLGRRWLRTTKVPLAGEDGRPRFLLGFSEDITERRRAEDRIRHLALHDGLTGLANRHLLHERMRQAMAAAKPGCGFAVHCLDLDGFKRVNDTQGHETGDRLLVQVAGRLRAAVREGDTIARIGGDEFVVLQTGVEGPEQTASLARRLAAGLAAPFELADQRAMIGTSIGIALYPGDGREPEELLRRADAALHRAKADGRGTFRHFDPVIHADHEERNRLEAALREAIQAEQITLHYQPICSVRERRLIGFEALARWQHPARGTIPPGVFVPLAEERGLIIPLGRLMLEKACAEAATWPQPARVAVNLSPAQFRVEDLAGEVADVLARTGLPAERLELEVTESLMIDTSERVLATMQALKAMGVRISLDDFGTGHASLSYLRRFPFDKMKIDRSFVQNLGQETAAEPLFRAVLSLGTSLGLEVLAEGVETEAQFALLEEFGCNHAQGYLLGRPMPPGVVRECLAAQGPAAPSTAPWSVSVMP